MFFNIIVTIMLITIGVSQILLYRSNVKNFRNIRESNRIRDDYVRWLIEDINSIASRIIKTEKVIVDQQNLLNKKINALEKFLDSHSTNVALQQNHFNALAKTDMLAARREELHRTKELKVALERLMGVSFISKQPPAPNDVLALENLTKRIEELQSILNTPGEDSKKVGDV